MVVIHRATLQDLERLARSVADLGGLAGGAPPARAAAVRRYAAALLAAIRADHDGKEEVLWPVVAAVAGASVDLAPLVDDHVAIAAAADDASRALARLGREPGAPGELHASVTALHGMLGEHIADEQAHVLPAMRSYLTAAAYGWCERQIQRRASLRDRMFTVPWLARHARPGELNRLLATGGWPTRVLLAGAWPGYARLERQAFAGRT
jgi:hypothetical protein